ncbi:MAG: SDR family NAD(P)-dependent oxidoreductase, partial [Anaerolineae bacterium]|nr:SDR family NAD(P)-dependent oxidoreductase [Anaerolineae bacterium]
GQRGALVTVADLDIEAAEQVAGTIQSAGGEARAARVDVTRRAEVEVLVEGVERDHGRLDYMFNNAGITV